MPGEFYIEGKKEKVDLSQILANQSQILTNQYEIESRVDSVKNQTNKLAGETPGETLGETETWKQALKTQNGFLCNLGFHVHVFIPMFAQWYPKPTQNSCGESSTSS